VRFQQAAGTGSPDHCTLISTRRFFVRPSRVLFSAIGLLFAEALSGNAPVGNALFNDIVADRGNAPPPPKPKPKPAMSYSISTGAISNRKVPTEELQTDMDV
jgi:hypothetical protein